MLRKIFYLSLIFCFSSNIFTVQALADTDPPGIYRGELAVRIAEFQVKQEQVKVFTEAVGCDGIIVTKLDGTAKGGVMIAVAEELGVSVDFIGIGEGIDDLQRFSADEFTEALFTK